MFEIGNASKTLQTNMRDIFYLRRKQGEIQLNPHPALPCCLFRENGKWQVPFRTISFSMYISMHQKIYSPFDIAYPVQN